MLGRCRRIAGLSKYAVFAPALLAQGVWVKKTIDRLPEATGSAGVVGDGARQVYVASIGDSLAAGVGVTEHRETVIGLLASKLAGQDTDVSVYWQVQAQSGLTAGALQDLLDYPALADCDVVVISIGANDAKNLHSADRWRTELTELMRSVRGAAPNALIVLLGVPPMECFPALPWPLSSTLGARAAFFDTIADEVCSSVERIERVSLEPSQVVGLFATDGFHPGGAVHDLLAEAIAQRLDALRVMATGS